jgi:hypothetical protein
MFVCILLGFLTSIDTGGLLGLVAYILIYFVLFE